MARYTQRHMFESINTAISLETVEQTAVDFQHYAVCVYECEQVQGPHE